MLEKFHEATIYMYVYMGCLMEFNKTENAFSPLPARTKASNADMTACLPLQDCIVQTTRPPAYGRIILRRYMGAARLHWQVLKLHVCARCCPAAAAVSQTAYKHSAVTCSGRIPNCMLAAAVDLLQWQDTKLQWQDTKLQWQDTKL
jgi:hypothetical protein